MVKFQQTHKHIVRETDLDNVGHQLHAEGQILEILFAHHSTQYATTSPAALS